MFEIITVDKLPDLTGHTCFVDTETCGLYEEVRLMQIFCPALHDKVWVIDCEGEVPEQLKKAHWVLHNGLYDFTCLKFKPENWDDTFLSGRLEWYYLESHSLDSMMTEVLGYDPYEEEGIVKKEMQKSDWSKGLTEKHIIYASIDVFLLPKVWELCKHQTETNSYKLDKHTINSIFYWQGNGFPVKVTELLLQEVRNITDIKAEALPINCNSYQQVRNYIGEESSDDAVEDEDGFEGVDEDLPFTTSDEPSRL